MVLFNVNGVFFINSSSDKMIAANNTLNATKVIGGISLTIISTKKNELPQMMESETKIDHCCRVMG